MTLKPWEIAPGKVASDAEIKKRSKTWSHRTWEAFLAATVEVAGSESVGEQFDLSDSCSNEQHEELQFIMETGESSMRGFIKEWLYEAIENLKARERRIIVCRYWHNMSDREIARKLKISKSTMRRMEEQARQKLGSELIKIARRARCEMDEKETWHSGQRNVVLELG